MTDTMNIKFGLSNEIAQSRMVDLAKLHENLIGTKSEYVRVLSDGEVQELAGANWDESLGSGVIAYKGINAIDDERNSSLDCYRLSGLSAIEREISNHNWKDSTGLKLRNFALSRVHALKLLDDVLDKTLRSRVPEWSLLMYILINTDEIVFLSNRQASLNDKSSQGSTKCNLSALDESLTLLNCVAYKLREKPDYFKKIFSRWAYRYYFHCLLLSLSNSDINNFKFRSKNNLTSRFRSHFALYNMMLRFGRRELGLYEKMAINSIESGSKNVQLIRKAISELDSVSYTVLERPKSRTLPLRKGSKKIVSVITVVRNLYSSKRIAHFELMLNSVASQTYGSANIEHVVIDGASNDGTLEHLQRMWTSKRVDKIVSEPDTGVYDAMNKGISYSNGDYFIFMNSDDYFSPSAIEDLVTAVENSDASYAYGDVWQIDDRNYKIGEGLGEIDSAWFKVPYCHQTLLCRSSHLSDYRFDENYKITMMAYASGLVLKGLKSAHVPKKIAFYRIGNGLSSSPANKVAYEREVRTAKLAVCAALGLPEKTYDVIDKEWRKVKAQAQLDKYKKILREEEKACKISPLLRRFFESAERYGQYRVNLFAEKNKCESHITKKPKVALITTHPHGGAGGAVHRLHLRLRSDEAMSSKLVTRDIDKSRSIPDVHLVSMPKGGWFRDQNKIGTNPDLTIFSVNESSLTDEALDRLIGDYDVFSLQWTARLLSAENIGKLVSSGKPVVITVRDMEPISGGCHCFHGCENWRLSDCSDCPQIIKGKKSIAANTLKTKLDQWSRGSLTFVALSDISRDIILQSPIAKGRRVEKISNGFDPDVFTILEKQEARHAIGLSKEFREAYLIGLIPSFSSTVKGFDLAVEVLNHAVKVSNSLGKKVKILLAGAGGASFSKKLEIESRTLGVINDGPNLNLFYSACDLLMVPSREETFSNTVAESLLSGTPVFGASTGAIPEMVVDGVNGMCFSHTWSVSKIAQSLEYCVEAKYQSYDCRRVITEGFSIDKQARQYSQLFNDLHKAVQ